MRPAKISLDECPHCGLSIESARGVCERHLPAKRTKSFTRIRIKPEDKKWADQVKDRDGRKCRRCGSTPKSQGLHAAHIFGRSKKATRLELSNGVSLCASCHRKADDDVRGFHEWCASWMGADEFEALRIRAESVIKRAQRKTA